MAKSHVITNRRKLDAFLRRGGKIGDIGLRVGQLSGKPKYPKGHVGSKSRVKGRTGFGRKIDRKELERRVLIRQGRKYLAGLDKDARKLELKRLRASLKKEGLSSRSLGRKRSIRAPVARVAGVLAAESGYHVRAMIARRPALIRELDQMRSALLGRGNVTSALKLIGRNAKEAVRHSFRSTGHVDTGRLLRNTQYELIDKPGLARAKAQAKAERAARRRAKRASRNR